jgi:hypothetical protein
MEAQCATLTNATLQLLLQKNHDSGPRLFQNLTGIFFFVGKRVRHTFGLYCF